MRNHLDTLLLVFASNSPPRYYMQNHNQGGEGIGPVWPQEFRTDIRVTGGSNSTIDLLYPFISGTFFYDSLNQQAATYLIYPSSTVGDWQFRRQVLKYGRVYDIDLATGECKSYPSKTRLDPAWLQKAFSFGGEEYLHSTAGDDDSYARVLMWKHWIEGDLPWNPRRQLIYYHRPVVGKRSPTCPDILSNRSSSSAGSGEGFRIMVRETGYYGGDKRRKNSNPPPLLIEFGCWTPGLEGVDKDFVFEVPYYC